MKRAIATSLLALAGWSAFAQGTLLFQNIAPGLDAPILGSSGARLWGENFKVELLVGRAPNSLTPVAATSFRNSPIGAGYFLGGVVTLDGYPGGSKPFIEVRAWDSNTGATYTTAKVFGASTVFLLGEPLGDPSAAPPTPPALLIGLTSFRFLPAEPSTFVFAVLGGTALLLYNRRRRSEKDIPKE